MDPTRSASSQPSTLEMKPLRIGRRNRISGYNGIKSAVGPFGPGFTFCFGQNNSRYLRCTMARWKCKKVDGSKAIAT
jgi:hypothetical protein